MSPLLSLLQMVLLAFLGHTSVLADEIGYDPRYLNDTDCQPPSYAGDTDYPTGPQTCLCTVGCEILVKTWTEWYVICFILIWGGCALAVIVWTLFRNCNLRKQKVVSVPKKSVFNSPMNNPLRDSSGKARQSLVAGMKGAISAQTHASGGNKKADVGAAPGLSYEQARASKMNIRQSLALKARESNSKVLQCLSETFLDKSDVELDFADDDDREEEDIRMMGFQAHWLGEIAFRGLILFFILMVFLLFLTVIGQYAGCQMTGMNNLCFHGNYPIFGGFLENGKVFVFCWHLTLAFCVGLLMCRTKLRNWFRAPVPLSQADIVWVWTPSEKPTLMSHPSYALRLVRRAKAWLETKYEGGFSASVAVEMGPNGERYILWQCQRYIWQPEKDMFAKVQYYVERTFDGIHRTVGTLTEKEAKERLAACGPNRIPYTVSSWSDLLLAEFASAFYLYQFLMYMVWVWFSYQVVGGSLICIVFLSGIFTVRMQRSNQQCVANMMLYETECEVFRPTDKYDNPMAAQKRQERAGNSKDAAASAFTAKLEEPVYKVMQACDLVVGDVVRIKGDSWKLPFDAVLLTGNCICDESGLTGESMPVRKMPIPSAADAHMYKEDDQDVYNLNGGAVKNMLFSGTTCLQAGAGAGSPVATAMIINTGLNTSKGELIANILYPKELLFKYNEEVLFVVFILLMNGVIMNGVNVGMLIQSGQEISFMTVWLQVIMAFANSFPPFLPLALKAGQTMSAVRLKDLSVFCTDVARVGISAKIRVFCFDKTGTLTKEGLDYLGVARCSAGPKPVLEDVSADLEATEKLTWGMATAHTLSLFGSRLVGNAVEVNMLNATGWSVVEDGEGKTVATSPSRKEVLKLLQVFAFDHALMTMSVVVNVMETTLAGGKGGLLHFVKGAPEKITGLCIPSTLPDGIIETSKSFAIDGCYVLALAYQELPSGSAGKKYQREELEKAGTLTFLGLLMFRNELKHDSARAIAALRDGDVRTVIVTGDNAQCAYYIARKAHFLGDRSKSTVVEKGEDTGRRMSTVSIPVMWLGEVSKEGGQVLFGRMIAKDSKLTPAEISERVTVPEMLERCRKHDEAVSRKESVSPLELAVTGHAFDMLVTTMDIMKLLFHIRVFARMTPDNKISVVQFHIDAGLIVGMCGDGGNDCGALRQAHAGIALSDAEASVVSPFTSHSKSVWSCVDLVREGRAALSSSFAGYKFQVVYGLVYVTMTSLVLYYGGIFSNTQYIWIDCVCILAICYCMTKSHPPALLAPKRPTASLLGPAVLVSVIGHFCLCMFWLFLAMVAMENYEGYLRWPAEHASADQFWYNSDNWETSIVWITCYLQLVGASMVFTFGHTSRLPIWQNYWIMGCFAMCGGIGIFLLLADENAISKLFHMATEQFNRENPPSPIWSDWQKENPGQTSPAIPFGLRLELFLLSMLEWASVCLWETNVVNGYLRNKARERQPVDRLKFGI